MNITDVLTSGGMEGLNNNQAGKEGAMMSTDSLLFALFLQSFSGPSSQAPGQPFEESLSDQPIFQNLFPAGKEANSGSNGEQSLISFSQLNPMFHTGQQGIYQTLLEELLLKDSIGGFVDGGTAQTALNGLTSWTAVDSIQAPIQDSLLKYLKPAENQPASGIQQRYPQQGNYGQALTALQTIGQEGISSPEVKIPDPAELEKYRITAEQFLELSGKIELGKNQKPSVLWHSEKQLMTGAQPAPEKQLISEKQPFSVSQPFSVAQPISKEQTISKGQPLSGEQAVLGKQSGSEAQQVLEQDLVSPRPAVPGNSILLAHQAERSGQGNPGINPGITYVNPGMDQRSEPASEQKDVTFQETAPQGEGGQELSSGAEGQEKSLAHSSTQGRIFAQAAALEQGSDQAPFFVSNIDDVSGAEKAAANKDLGMADQARVWDQVLAMLKKQDHKAETLKELSLKLHPAELGKVDVSLRLENGFIHVTLNASEQATGLMLQNHLQDLRAGLAEMGVSCGSLELGYSQDNDQLGSGRENYPDPKGPSGYLLEEENTQAPELNWYTQLTGAGSRINVSA